MQKGFNYIKEAIKTSDTETEFAPMKEKLVKYEEISDRIEYEVVNYLNKIDRESLSDNSASRIKSIYRIVGEMESLGDSGESISRVIARAIDHKQKLSEEHKKNLFNMSVLLDRAYDAMVFNLDNAYKIKNIDNAVSAEIDINTLRDALREKELEKVDNNGEAYFEGVYYLSVLEEMEKMGDFIINISQSVLSWRKKLPDASATWDD